jgi:hypothetical protein
MSTVPTTPATPAAFPWASIISGLGSTLTSSYSSLTANGGIIAGLAAGGMAALSVYSGNYVAAVPYAIAAIGALHLNSLAANQGTHAGLLSGILGLLTGSAAVTPAVVAPAGNATLGNAPVPVPVPVPVTPAAPARGGLLKRLRQLVVGSGIVAGTIHAGSLATPPPGPQPQPAPVPRPRPPTPPVVPVDPLTQSLRVAYTADGGPTTANVHALSLLAELYRQATVLAADKSIATLSELLEKVQTVAGSLLKPGDLPTTRKLLAVTVGAAMPTDAPLTDATRAKAGTLFGSLANALGGL